MKMLSVFGVTSVDRYRRLCADRRHFGGGNGIRAPSSTGRHNGESSHGLRSGVVVVNGACVARRTVRQARRRARWNGGVCAQWY